MINFLSIITLINSRSKSILAKFSSRAKRIDVISRFIFPLLFAIFNLAYWLYYLLAKGSNESYKD